MTAQGSQVPEQQQTYICLQRTTKTGPPTLGEQPPEDAHSKEEPAASTAYDSEVPGRPGLQMPTLAVGNIGIGLLPMSSTMTKMRLLKKCLLPLLRAHR